MRTKLLTVCFLFLAFLVFAGSVEASPGYKLPDDWIADLKNAEGSVRVKNAEDLFKGEVPPACSSWVPNAPVASSAALADKLDLDRVTGDPNDEPEVWWACEVIYNTQYLSWLLDELVLSDEDVFYTYFLEAVPNGWGDSFPNNHAYIFWFRAIPLNYTSGFYRFILWDVLIPYEIDSSYRIVLFDLFIPYGDDPYLGTDYYKKTFIDKAIPNNYASGYYRSLFWDRMIPNNWTGGYYFTLLWDKMVPYKYANGYYFAAFWDHAVPDAWAAGYFRNKFWKAAVPNKWAGSYYYNTLKNKAIPNKWANRYYANH